MYPKLKILSSPQVISLYKHRWHANTWAQSFELEVLDRSKFYDKKNCVIWLDQYEDNAWAERFRQAGYKIVCDKLFDSDINDPSTVANATLTLRAKNYMWINEYNMYSHLGYKDNTQPPDPLYFMLMLMNLRRAHRHQVLLSMQEFLPSSLYSYVSQGITLPDDEITTNGHVQYDRFFQPRWYSQTAFSMVIETSVDDNLFISEKSFKPLAHRHAFMIYGTPGNLQHLKSLGFQTFDHLIDESYDHEHNTPSNTPNAYGEYLTSMNRLDKIVQNLAGLYKLFQQDKFLFADAESMRRIQHNHELFYNQSLVQQMWQKEIVDVVEEFVND